MTLTFAAAVGTLWLAEEQVKGVLEAFPPLAQLGVLGFLLAVAGITIRGLFKVMIKSKDDEIVAANKRADAAEDRGKTALDAAESRVKTAEDRAERYAKKLEDQQERIEREVLNVLRDASTTTRRALETTRGGHDSRRS